MIEVETNASSKQALGGGYKGISSSGTVRVASQLHCKPRLTCDKRRLTYPLYTQKLEAERIARVLSF